MNLPQSLRIQLLTLVMGAPAVMGVFGIMAIEGYRVVRPDSLLYGEPPAESFADAIRLREVELAYAFIRAGQDPNKTMRFRDLALTGERTVMVSPLMLAVSAHNGSAVMMLLSFGVRMDLAQNELAACLARDVGNDDLARIIIRDGGPQSTATCPERTTASEVPLLKYVEALPHE